MSNQLENINEIEERQLTLIAINELKRVPVKGNFDFKHLSEIHSKIFKDIRDHAGQKRPPSAPSELWTKQGYGHFSHLSSVFADVRESEKIVDDAREKLGDFKSLDKEEFINKFTEAYAEVNQAHPFRDGNGRSTRTMFEQLAKEAGYELKLSEVDKEEWDYASLKSGQNFEFFVHEGETYGDEKPTDKSYLAKIMSEQLKPIEKNVEQDKLASLTEDQKVKFNAVHNMLVEVYANDPEKQALVLSKLDASIPDIASGATGFADLNTKQNTNAEISAPKPKSSDQGYDH